MKGPSTLFQFIFRRNSQNLFTHRTKRASSGCNICKTTERESHEGRSSHSSKCKGLVKDRGHDRYFKSFFEASPMKKTKNKSKNTRKSMATQGVQARVNRSMPTRRLSSVKVQLTDTLVFNSKNQIHVTLGLCC